MCYAGVCGIGSCADSFGGMGGIGRGHLKGVLSQGGGRGSILTLWMCDLGAGS